MSDGRNTLLVGAAAVVLAGAGGLLRGLVFTIWPEPEHFTVRSDPGLEPRSQLTHCTSVRHVEVYLQTRAEVSVQPEPESIVPALLSHVTPSWFLSLSPLSLASSVAHQWPYLFFITLEVLTKSSSFSGWQKRGSRGETDKSQMHRPMTKQFISGCDLKERRDANTNDVALNTPGRMDGACYNLQETRHIPEPGTNHALKPPQRSNTTSRNFHDF